MLTTNDLIQAIGASGGRNTLVAAFANLCEISYLDAAKIPTALAAVTTPGTWSCAWGPVLSSDGANLVYVATCAEDDQTVLTAVVVRGTDLDFHDVPGLLEQLKQDADVLNMVKWPGGPDGARIAQGTMDGLAKVGAMTWNGHSLADFLHGVVGDRPLIVTGHSLGGCLTSVLAPWLRQQLPAARIVPVTFAAPSAGNATFAELVHDAAFPDAIRCYNSLDLIPTAWAGLGSMPFRYYYAYDFPEVLERDVLKAAVAVILAAMVDENASYQQPARVLPLQGAFVRDVSWVQEALAQHAIKGYVKLLGGTPVT